MEENIVLCGFMGCGKTTVGKKLAKETGRIFCDTDQYLEKKYEMKIPQIFEELGEERFREMEKEVLEEISSQKNLVIACGGGTVLRDENVQILKKGGKIYFLNVPFRVIQIRLKNDKKRPLLQRPDRRQFIQKLFKERIAKYKKAADFTINAGFTIKLAVKKIIEKSSKSS